MPAHPTIDIKKKKRKEAYARPFGKVYQIISCKSLHLSTFEEIEQKYLTRFSKYNFRQPPAFINYDNTQYLLGGRNYGIQFYQRLKKNFSNLVVFKIQIKGKLLSNKNEVDCF